MKNRNKLILLLTLPLLLGGCAHTDVTSEASSSSVASTSNSISSVSENSSSMINSSSKEESSSTTSSLSSSSEVKNYITSLATVREKAYALSSQVNSVNVAESNIPCKMNLKLLARFDMITTKSGMGDRYKLLMTDGVDYIYVKVNSSVYSKVENKIDSVLSIEGNVSLYCGEPEITHNGVLEVVSENITLADTLFPNKTLQEVYSITDNMTFNSKGCNGGNLATISVQFLAKMDNSVALFYDGTNIIQVHGKSNFSSGMTSGRVYDIKGAINVYNFRPGFEYYSRKDNSTLTIPEIDKSKLEKLDSNVYKTYYEVDKNAKYQAYSDLFKKLRVVEGYVDYYIKDGKYYTVITEENKDNVYSMYQNARDAKALFLKNDCAVNLATDRDIHYNVFDEYYTDEKISVIVTPYLWNNLKYWQIYALEDTISVCVNESI